MKKVLFCMLTLLFTATLFIQSSFGDHWFLHQRMGGPPIVVYDIGWINNTEFIIGGKDTDDDKAWLRKMDVDGNFLWGRRVKNVDGSIGSVEVSKNNPSYVVCSMSEVDSNWYYLLTYYTSSGNFRNQVDSWNERVWISTIANDERSRYGADYFAVGFTDGILHLWDLGSRNNPIRVGRVDTGDEIFKIDWAYNLLISDRDFDVYKRDPDRLGHISRHYIDDLSNGMYGLQRCGDYVVTGAYDGYIRIYDYYNGQLTQRKQVTSGVIQDLDCGPGGNLLAVSSSASLRIWNFDASVGRVTTLKHTFLNGETAYNGMTVEFSPNGYHLAYSQWDGLYIFKTNNSPAAPSTGTDEPESLPAETAVLSNYPNPFNPETWIPYQLAKPAEVTVSIHSADGKLVRMLELGQLPAGVYQDRERAAYWDGRNEQGESVASGVYFYTLKAGDFAATKKMLIRK